MSFCHGTPKLGVQLESPEILEIGTFTTLEAHNFCEDLQLKWDLKQSCSPRWNPSNGMWIFTQKQVNQGDFQLLVVKSQIGSFTPGPSFGDNLCFNYSNGSCKPIVDIYISRDFQCY
jgi:hypothetical protein